MLQILITCFVGPRGKTSLALYFSKQIIELWLFEFSTSSLPIMEHFILLTFSLCFLRCSLFIFIVTVFSPFHGQFSFCLSAFPWFLSGLSHGSVICIHFQFDLLTKYVNMNRHIILFTWISALKSVQLLKPFLCINIYFYLLKKIN